MRRTGLAAAIWAAVVCAAGGLPAQDRMPVWSGWAEDGYGGAADCTDCFEAEYVLMSCARGADEVRVELIGLVPPEDAGDRLAVTLEVGGAGEVRAADVEISEMFGAVPVLTLPAGDPLFARLRGGGAMTLAIEGDRLEIPLTGASEALDAMFAACR